MIKEIVIKDINDVRLFSSDASLPLDPIPNTPIDNWGFDSDNENPTADTIYFDGGTKYRIEYSIRNVLIKTKKPSLISDNTSYTIFKNMSGSYVNNNETVYLKTWTIKLVIFDSLGLSIENISLLNDGTDISDYISNPKLNKNGNLYTYTCKLTTNPKNLTELTISNLSFSIYDIAGNLFTFSDFEDFTYLDVTLSDLIDSLSHLELNFVNIVPENLCLGEQVTGNCDLEAYNPNLNSKYWDLLVETYGDPVYDFELLDNSIGYLIGDVTIDDDLAYQHLDGIDSAGTVYGSVYVKFNISEEYDDLFREYTIAYNNLGPFIKKCKDTRDLYLTIPKYLVENEFNDFKEYVEYFLNTVYDTKTSDESCKIGVIEKIKRIGDFNDPSQIEDQLFSNFSSEQGNELDLSITDVTKLVDFFNSNNILYSPTNTLREIYKNFPIISKYKGTNSALYMLFNLLGFFVTIYPLWIDKATKSHFYTEEEILDFTKYILSSHILIDFKTNEDVKLSKLNEISEIIVKLAKSIIPATRVIENIQYDIDSLFEVYLMSHSYVSNGGIQDSYLVETYYYNSSSLNLHNYSTTNPISQMWLEIPYIGEAAELKTLASVLSDNTANYVIDSTTPIPNKNSYNLMNDAVQNSTNGKYYMILEYDNRTIVNGVITGTINYAYKKVCKCEVLYDDYTMSGFTKSAIRFYNRTQIDKVSAFLKEAKKKNRVVSISYIFNTMNKESVRFCNCTTTNYEYSK